MALADLVNDGSFAVRFRCSVCFDSGKTWEDNDVGAVLVPCHRCRCSDCGRETAEPLDGICDDCRRMAMGAQYDGKELR